MVRLLSPFLRLSFSLPLSLSLSLGKLLALGIVCEEVFNECTFGAQQLSLSYTHTHTHVCACVRNKKNTRTPNSIKYHLENFRPSDRHEFGLARCAAKPKVLRQTQHIQICIAPCECAHVCLCVCVCVRVCLHLQCTHNLDCVSSLKYLPNLIKCQASRTLPSLFHLTVK